MTQNIDLLIKTALLSHSCSSSIPLPTVRIPLSETRTINFCFDLGLVYSGSPEASLNVVPTAGMTAALAADVKKEEADLQESLDDFLELWPVMSWVGLPILIFSYPQSFFLEFGFLTLLLPSPANFPQID